MSGRARSRGRELALADGDRRCLVIRLPDPVERGVAAEASLHRATVLVERRVGCIVRAVEQNVHPDADETGVDDEDDEERDEGEDRDDLPARPERAIHQETDRTGVGTGHRRRGDHEESGESAGHARESHSGETVHGSLRSTG